MCRDLVFGVEILIQEVLWDQIIKAVFLHREARSVEGLERRFKRLFYLFPLLLRIFGTNVCKGRSLAVNAP